MVWEGNQVLGSRFSSPGRPAHPVVHLPSQPRQTVTLKRKSKQSLFSCLEQAKPPQPLAESRVRETTWVSQWGCSLGPHQETHPQGESRALPTPLRGGSQQEGGAAPTGQPDRLAKGGTLVWEALLCSLLPTCGGPQGGPNKHHRLVAWNKCTLTVVEAGSPKSRCQQGSGPYETLKGRSLFQPQVAASSL